ncbi:putative ATP-dependent helicase Lhr [Planctomycetes bacterium Poly30]|uniref:Putative ATP-dependent helicase Lhr n=1 Tax=Saltatorellus ferox TaxID=2528018 RepID=A0A518ENF7_9BACT|nr:putative ATP-dependent helicase Lhr [Planctomycetes bacterium Poly30]
MDVALTWFQARGWEPFEFQRETWQRYLAGQSGLIHAPTGFGKSLAAWMGPLIEAQAEKSARVPGAKRADAPPLTVIWVTPMRALAKDLVQNLGEVAREVAPGWTVEGRSGDTSSTVRGRQARRLPTALVTTPESLTVLLSGEEAAERFASVRCVVVDEWHELFGTKRGVQTELALARLRSLGNGVRTWGLSATLGNLEEAASALMGAGKSSGAPTLVRGEQRRDLRVETLLPASIERFPWSGHMGLRLLEEVAAELDTATSALVFTNTRHQAERWYQALCYARYDERERIALHHGSLDQEQRHEVEEGLRSGRLWAVVATSSLDLGVDFTPVDLVFQIGSPKGVARLAQRAGRSGHSPGKVSRLVNVPAQALELIEFAAAREALARGEVESRSPIERPLDVLAQHVVTVAIGGGFRAEELLAEVRTTHAYRDLSEDEWNWVLEFARFGGDALSGYERFARIRERADGVFVGGNKRVIREHRINIGTISGFGTLAVAFRNGRKLGHVEETFLARLRPGESFTFAGKPVELIRIEDSTAYVRPAKKVSALMPRWSGGRMPLSNELTHAVRRAMAEVTRVLETGEVSASPELNAVAPVLAFQRQISHIPSENELLIERVRTRDGDHAFLFPLAGRLVHEGLAALLAWRATRRQAITITQSVSDWGVELLTRKDLPVGDEDWRALLSPDDLLEDLLRCLDGAGLAKRHFREIARVAGLIHPGMPGARKGQRQLQASAGLIFEVLTEHDPENLLLLQARREVMERTLELTRMREALEAIQRCTIRVTRPTQLTPLAFPLWAERMRDRVSSESWEDRVRAMAEKLEASAGAART